MGAARNRPCWPPAYRGANGQPGARAATPTTRTGAILTRLYVGAGRADDAQGIPRAVRPHRCSGQDAVSDPSAHVATWLRLRPGERGPRHSVAPSLAGAQEHPAHGALHRVGTASVQGLLALTLPAMRACMTPSSNSRFSPRERLARLGWWFPNF